MMGASWAERNRDSQQSGREEMEMQLGSQERCVVALRVLQRWQPEPGPEVSLHS